MELYETLYALVLVGLVSGVLSVLAPGHASATGKYVRYALSAAVVVAVLFPVVRATGFLSELDGATVEAAAESLRVSYEEQAAAARVMVIDQGIAAAESSLCRSVCSRFSLSEEDVTVGIRVADDGETLTAEEIRVTLGIGAFALGPEEVADYVTGLAGCPCTVEFV